ncbi:uncharacterized protein PFL1_06526 [Pseudozyma flocculosa PF-1]|uniref:P-loop containing nucleoside triphosphate hydrolase protein n=1 Tax=Pseudozyma flocculosa PF-1 TaxID=1277687 RepID=A0A061H5H1_9BASI|nr:uncharacterized protein PFL1_06526 [Pseudozyma flocculosa PF-1]EPQ25851.1 hypothetical protein PFL1_06526 [Pseudozyma flocculosa PF-1]
MRPLPPPPFLDAAEDAGFDFDAAAQAFAIDLDGTQAPGGLSGLDFDELARECGLEVEDAVPSVSPLGLDTGQEMAPASPYSLEVPPRVAKPPLQLDPWRPSEGLLQAPATSWRLGLDFRDAQRGQNPEEHAQDVVPPQSDVEPTFSQFKTPGSTASRITASSVSAPSAIQARRVPQTPEVAGVRLFPVSALPDSILHSDQHIVVSAPTGSGKTVIFELAILRMLQSGPPESKAVYLAPTKALCSEKTQDWTRRFQHQDCPVVELTGDSFAGLAAARKCRLIVSTPEKWDSLTRRWHDHSRILSSIQVMLLDEVHILNEPVRGDSSNSAANPPAAKTFKFGEEFRPCPLQKFVYSYPPGKDEFSFQNSLNHKLYDLILRHSRGRPSLVFVSTRKATAQAAEIIAERYRKTEGELRDGAPAGLPWPKPRPTSRAPKAAFADAALDRLASLGIAFHHAGLSYEDRKEVERRFLSEEIRVLCSTSTLATGVNLPAYCVVVRGTRQYAGNQWTELGDLDVIQMIGRAGRPQFDRDGVAVIMCENPQRQRFEDLVGGGRDIESTLGDGLIEHINAEIGLGSTRDVGEVERWLRTTFYAVRLRRKATDAGEVDNLISRVCGDAVRLLGDHRLVQRHGPDSARLEATEAGAIMSRYFLSYATMLRLLEIEPRPSLPRILETLSCADEFSDLRIRQVEKPFLQALRVLPEIRFPPKAVGSVADKVSILIQTTLAGINIQPHLQSAATSGATSFSPFAEIGAIFRHAPRICKAMLDLALDRSDGAMAKATFELLRSLCGKAWDASPAVLRQLEGVGERSIKALAAGGLGTLAQIADAAPHDIELLLNRNPPFGSKVIQSARSLPRFDLSVVECQKAQTASAPAPLDDDIDGDADSRPSVVVNVAITVGLRDYAAVSKRSRTSGLPIYVCVLTLSSDLDLCNFSRLPISKLSEPRSLTVSCRLNRRGQKVVVLAGSDEVAGSLVRAELRPDLPDSAFPAPRVSRFGVVDPDQQWENEQLLEGLDADTDFRLDDVDLFDEGGRTGKATSTTPVRAGTKMSVESEELPERLANGNYR